MDKDKKKKLKAESPSTGTVGMIEIGDDITAGLGNTTSGAKAGKKKGSFKAGVGKSFCLILSS